MSTEISASIGKLIESDLETITPRMTRSWLLDKHIVVFRITAADRDTVDAWIECVKQTMLDWPKDRPYLAIHDMRADKVSLTPYARARAQELIPLSAGAPGYAAILLSPSFVSHMIRLFLRAQKQQGNENQLFFTMEDAVKWLQRRVRRS